MENIYTSLKPFYVYAKLLGTFPLSFVGKPINGVLKVKPHDILITGFSFVLLIGLIFLELYFETFIKSDSSILTKASKASVAASLLLLVLSLFYQISRRNEIKRFLELLSNFDEELKLLGASINYKDHKKGSYKAAFLTISILLFTYVLAPLFHLYSGYHKKFNYIILVIYAYVTLYKLFYTLQFCLASCAIRLRFKILNNCLREHKIFHDEVNIKLSSKLYLDLCDGIEVINRTCTFHLIFVTISCSLINIFCDYEVVREIWISKSDATTSIIAPGILSVLQYYILILMGHYGYSTSQEAEQTSTFVGRLMQSFDKFDTDQKNFQNFLILTKSRNLNLQNSLFICNWNVLVATTSTVITYLVITIQFDTSFIKDSH